MSPRVQQSAAKRNRRGTATVELALSLPFILFLTLSTIDICSAQYLKGSLTLAAYEGARIGVQQGGTNDLAFDRVREVLDERGVSYEEDSIEITSDADFNTAETLEHITLQVRVPCLGNMPITGNLFQGRVLDASVTMRKEYGN